MLCPSPHLYLGSLFVALFPYCFMSFLCLSLWYCAIHVCGVLDRASPLLVSGARVTCEPWSAPRFSCRKRGRRSRRSQGGTVSDASLHQCLSATDEGKR